MTNSIEPRLLISYPKLYFKRDLVGYTSHYDDLFEYQSIENAVIPDGIYRVIATTSHRTRIEDDLERGKFEFDYLVRWAGRRFNAEHWYLASLNRDVIGFVFPQMFPDAGELGSVWHIGVLPEFQGRGFGRILHARALETLASIGAKRYIGSTEPENVAMRRIFETNGCKMSGMRIIEEFENGTGRAL